MNLDLLTLPPRNTEYCEWAMRAIYRQRSERLQLEAERMLGIVWEPDRINIDWPTVTLAPIER